MVPRVIPSLSHIIGMKTGFFCGINIMERKYKLAAIHSQSNRPDSPLSIEGHPDEQAYESRAMSLPADVIGLSKPIESEYLIYYKNRLRQTVPEIIIPKRTDSSLSHSFIKDKEARSRLKNYFDITEKRGVLSVFDPTENERQMLQEFRNDGIPFMSEVDYELAYQLGNKAGFRSFCKKYDLPQMPGGVFSEICEVRKFVDFTRIRGFKSVLKHPNGTAGEGLIVTDTLNSSQIREVSNWMDGAGQMVAEQFSPGGTEHSIHIYVDPISKKPEMIGIYEQLVAKTDNGFAHYGCRYPVEDHVVLDRLSNIAENKIVPALSDVNYTGPACLDVLADPDHFMELNTRAGANMYAHQMVKRVARSVYGLKNPDRAAFVFLAGLNHDRRSFEYFAKHKDDLLAPKSNGMLIFSNPGRHEFGSFDVIAMSPQGLSTAEGILYEGLIGFWGKQEAQGFLDRIYRR